MEAENIRAADAKEVGVGNPAEETYCYPNTYILKGSSNFVNPVRIRRISDGKCGNRPAKSNFTIGLPPCQASRPMWKKSLILLPVLLTLLGCATTGTNLSAQRQLRNTENLYPVEAIFDSRQQALRWDSVQATVVVGKESYPMRRTHMMRNRWECLIPVPVGVTTADYHYKFDYLYNDFGGPKKGSASSKTYKLQIID